MEYDGLDGGGGNAGGGGVFHEAWGCGGGVGLPHVPVGDGDIGLRMFKLEKEFSRDGGGAGLGGGIDGDVDDVNRFSVSALAINPSLSVARDETKLLTLRRS